MTTPDLVQSEERIVKGPEEPSRWERPALASGLLFVAVQIATTVFTAVFFATTHPTMDASPAEAARGFAENAPMVAIGTYLYVLQLPFWLLFLGGLFCVLRRAEGGGGALAISVVGAGVAMTPLALALSAFPRALLLGATSAVLLEARLAPRWIGWSGLALGLVSFVSTSTLVTPVLFPFLALGTLLFVVWVAALTFALLRSPRTKGRIPKRTYHGVVPATKT